MPKILLIDDDEQIRSALKLVLISSGYEVIEASNGSGVESIYQHHQPDLIITDLLMPEKEGLEVIMELRRINDQVKIIAMSGGGQWGLHSTLVAAEKLGAQQILTKPFTRERFLQAVRSVIEMTE